MKVHPCLHRGNTNKPHTNHQNKRLQRILHSSSKYTRTAQLCTTHCNVISHVSHGEYKQTKNQQNLSLHGQLWNPFNVTSQCVVIMHICAVRAESVGLLNKSPRGCRLVWAGNFENHLLLLSAAHDSRTSKVWLPSISTASLQGDRGVRSASTTLHGIEVKIGKI